MEVRSVIPREFHLSKRDGLDPSEKVITHIGCNFLRFQMKGLLGSSRGEYSSGELVLTHRGLVFLESTGMFRTSRKRLHSYRYEDIQSIAIETRGFTGAVSGNVHLAVGYSTPRGVMTVKYSLHQDKAAEIIRLVEEMRRTVEQPDLLRGQVLRLVKPRGEVSLHEIAKDGLLKKMIAQVGRESLEKLSPDRVFKDLKSIVEELIANGELDGIITDDGRYISNTMLGRKTVQYQVVIDFTSLYSQLENKGIVLQTIECPSCGGNLDYPETGSIMQCKYCQSTVSAVDIFEKFKSLL
ncbi:MAG: hypothetical protein EAX95_11190 [Candidatus Thorarchaeota archaeon]|nr:hypothetical protein [Candidatus Thorarchaeota archaeon]